MSEEVVVFERKRRDRGLLDSFFVRLTDDGGTWVPNWDDLRRAFRDLGFQVDLGHRIRLHASPPRVRPGDGVCLETFGWLPTDDAERFAWIVKAPHGATAAVQLGCWGPGMRSRVVYPDDFLRSSTGEEGKYTVALQRSGGGAVVQGSFLVSVEPS